MTKLNKRRGHQAYKILPIFKAVETAILITITIYKAIRWAIEEIRTQGVSSQTNGPEEGAVAFEMSAKWYSSQLSREIVHRLYHRAKFERIPMTVLANRIMEKALDTERVIVGANTEQDALNQQRSRRAETGSDTRA